MTPEAALVAAIERQAMNDWRAAGSLLERRYPERWSRASRPEPVAAAPVGAWAEVDELARRRAR